MEVERANGDFQAFDKAKIKKRLENLTFSLNTDYVSVDEVVSKVEDGLYDKVIRFISTTSRPVCLYFSCMRR